MSEQPSISLTENIVVDRDVLAQRSRKTSWEEIKQLDLVNRLKTALATTWTKGAGLAAIQIGVPLQVAYYVIGDKEHVLVNPTILRVSNPGICAKEGCLSMPNKWFRTMRYGRIMYSAELETGRTTYLAEGMEAVILQHEIDHMYGVLCCQRLAPPSVKTGRNETCPCGSGKKFKKCCIDKGGEEKYVEKKQDPR